MYNSRVVISLTLLLCFIGHDHLFPVHFMSVTVVCVLIVIDVFYTSHTVDLINSALCIIYYL